MNSPKPAPCQTLTWAIRHIFLFIFNLSRVTMGQGQFPSNIKGFIIAMRILVSDRDRLASQMICARLVQGGHEVIEESVKNAAIERVSGQAVDIVFFDPAPLANARPFILGLRRSLEGYVYIAMLGHDVAQDEAMRSGVNDILKKPIDQVALDRIVGNAKRLGQLVHWMGDIGEDFPSAGGVIAKSAFNQLFLSAIDRADRYGEPASLLRIGVDNYQTVLNEDGPQSAAYLSSKLAQHLVRLRRQSDIIGQTGRAEFSLLLQRPQTPQEPIDAANRFAASLSELDDIASSGLVDAHIAVQLVNLPTGEEKVSHQFIHKGEQAKS